MILYGYRVSKRESRVGNLGVCPWDLFTVF